MHPDTGCMGYSAYIRSQDELPTYEQLRGIFRSHRLLHILFYNLHLYKRNKCIVLLYLSKEATKRKEEGHCIRCAKCADSCPMGLEPFLINRLYKAGDLAGMEKASAQDCIECGCCQYSCPANIPLVDNLRMAKGQVMAVIKNRRSNGK